MVLSQQTCGKYMMETFQTHWVKEEHNLVILSSFSIEPPNITKMIQLFSLNIWLLILISTLVITLFNTFYNRLSGESNFDLANITEIID